MTIMLKWMEFMKDQNDVKKDNGLHPYLKLN